jgi:hypothetical protein
MGGQDWVVIGAYFLSLVGLFFHRNTTHSE